MELRAFSPSCPLHPSSSPSPTMSQLGWEAAACGLSNLASELDVAVCRLHYYLQRMHGVKVQLDSVWRPTALRMASLEASFRADVESYLVGVRQDVARLETSQFALRRLLASDSSSSPVSVSASGCSPSFAESPRKPVYYRRYSSLSPRKPALTTLKEETSRTDSDESREDVSSRKKRKLKKRSEKGGSDPAVLAAELGKKLKRIADEDVEALDSSTTSSDSETHECTTASLPGTPASGGSEPGGDGGGEGVDAPEGATPTSDANGSAGGQGANGLQSSQDSSITRLDSVSPRSALEEISEHQAALHDHLQVHSQRLLLVASTRRRFGSSGGFVRHRRQPRLGEAFADPRALQLAVEAAARELLSAREPLVQRAEALRRLAAAMDEARPPPQSAGQQTPQQPPQQLRDLRALRLQPLPELSGARRGSGCLHLWRVLRRWDCADFCAALWDFLCGCFCCCTYRPSFTVRQQPTYESTWLMRSPPRTYNTCP